MAEIADLFDLATGQTKRSQVPEDKVIVRTLGLKLVVVLEQRLRDGTSVVDDSLSVSLESRVGGLLERDGDGGDGLCTGSDAVQRLRGNARCCEDRPGMPGRRHR